MELTGRLKYKKVVSIIHQCIKSCPQTEKYTLSQERFTEMLSRAEWMERCSKARRKGIHLLKNTYRKIDHANKVPPNVSSVGIINLHLWWPESDYLSSLSCEKLALSSNLTNVTGAQHQPWSDDSKCLTPRVVFQEEKLLVTVIIITYIGLFDSWFDHGEQLDRMDELLAIINVSDGITDVWRIGRRKASLFARLFCVHLRNNSVAKKLILSKNSTFYTSKMFTRKSGLKSNLLM